MSSNFLSLLLRKKSAIRCPSAKRARTNSPPMRCDDPNSCFETSYGPASGWKESVVTKGRADRLEESWSSPIGYDSLPPCCRKEAQIASDWHMLCQAKGPTIQPLRWFSGSSIIYEHGSYSDERHAQPAWWWCVVQHDGGKSFGV